MYQVSIPGKTLTFINTGSRAQPRFIPQLYSNDSLYSDISHDTTYAAWPYYDHNYFILVDEDATRYVFKKALKRPAIPTPKAFLVYYAHNIFHTTPISVKSEWLLTAILSHDYVDHVGDTLNPLDRGSPNTDNDGDWVAFVYSGFINDDEGDVDILHQSTLTCSNCDAPYVDAEDYTEIAYLRKIITPTTVAVFNLHELRNYRTVRYVRSHYQADNRIKQGMLSHLGIYTYSGDSTTPTGSELYGATFTYETTDTTPLREKLFTRAFMELDDVNGEPSLLVLTVGTDNEYRIDDLASEYKPYGYKKHYTFAYYDSLHIYNELHWHGGTFEDTYNNWLRAGPCLHFGAMPYDTIRRNMIR